MVEAVNNTHHAKAMRDAALETLQKLRRDQIRLRQDIEDAEEAHRLACACYNASVTRDRRHLVGTKWSQEAGNWVSD